MAVVNESPRGGPVVPPGVPIDWGVRNWRSQAACRGMDPEMFVSAGQAGVGADHLEAVKAVCRSCGVREPCLQLAVETDQQAGFWGGATVEERRGLRAAWLAGRRSSPTARHLRLEPPTLGQA